MDGMSDDMKDQDRLGLRAQAQIAGELAAERAGYSTNGGPGPSTE
jgi:hypothetical protein